MDISDVFNCYNVNINGTLNTPKLGGKIKHFNLHQPNTNISKCRVDQHVTVVNSYRNTSNKVLIMEFMTVKVSQNQKLMPKNVNTVKLSALLV